MKRGILIVFMLSFLPLIGTAQDSGLGIGIIVGEPTGISLKKWTSATTAIDGAVAWAFDRNTSVQLHGDFLMHNFNLLKTDVGRLPVYYGVGGRVKFDDERRRGRDTDRHTRVGVRVPVGMAYLFDRAPVDVFLEIVPILDLAPSSDFGLNAAIGARYFFN